MENTIITAADYNAWFGNNHVVKHVHMEIPANQVIAIMGPSGCGKPTFLRGINRMHELTPGATSTGKILLKDENILEKHPILVRLRIGMVFQKPNPFPNLSIYENVIAGYRLNGINIAKNEKDEIVEQSLKSVALWNEVKDDLNKKGTFLSGGQQQRLCIARAVAMRPEVLLFDEPTSALDPISTATVEELFLKLKGQYTLIIVTHNMQQASRVSDKTAFFYMGELAEYGDTRQVFDAPADPRTQNYISGKFS